MKNQNEFMVKLKILEDFFLEHLMERIEHPEVAVLFERFRDFQDDVEGAKVRITEKIENRDFI